MTYTVVIKHGGEEARLPCLTMEEAQLVRRSFINWGGLGYDIAQAELEKIKRSGVPTPIQGGLNLGVVSLKEHFGVLE